YLQRPRIIVAAHDFFASPCQSTAHGQAQSEIIGRQTAATANPTARSSRRQPGRIRSSSAYPRAISAKPGARAPTLTKKYRYRRLSSGSDRLDSHVAHLSFAMV